MKIIRKRSSIIAFAIVCLLSAAAFSKPGRATITKVLAVLQQAPDVEQRARSKHGWSAAEVNSVVRGTITYYDQNGMSVARAGLTLYRAYPSMLRMELNRNGVVEVSGFDQVKAWRAGVAQLNEQQARDIRAILRMWPERLFVARAAGMKYREVGRFVDDSNLVPTAIATPSSPSVKQPRAFDQVEIEDTIGAPPALTEIRDRRLVSYLIDRESLLVSGAKWLEPDKPGLINNPKTPLTSMSLDFSRYGKVNGVSWPMEVTHRMGGKVDFRIQVTDVLMNQPLPDTLFVKP